MPVHNAEQYVAEAVECIVGQTYANWELVVVDDASSDGSIGIVEAAAVDDSRIKMIANERNEGAAESRNIGMDAARGRYIWFADADDTFDLDLLKRAAAEIEATDAQIVLFGLVERYFDARGKLLYCNEISMEPVRCASPREWRSEIIELERDTHFGYAACKFYDLEFLRQERVRFQSLLLYEDFAFNVDAFRHAESIAIIAGTPYHYRKIEGKSTTNANAYTYAQYYELAKGRIASLRELLDEWDVFDDHARAVLGSLYARYLISAIERTYHANAKLGKAQRAEFIVQLMDDPLFDELIPYAQAKDSRIAQKGIRVLQSRNVSACARFGKMVNLARTYMYGLFTKLRSGR